MRKDLEKEKVVVLCQKLRELREEKGISQRKIAELTGLSPTGIRHIESLETSPTLYSILKYTKALEVELSELLNDL